MRLKRAFSRATQPDGRLVYRKRYVLPMPVIVQHTLVTLEKSAAGRNLSYSWFVDGVLQAQGSRPGDEPFAFAPKFKVSKGRRKFLLIVEGFEPNETVTGTVEIVVSFF
jgi:hypothetical protein